MSARAEISTAPASFGRDSLARAGGAILVAAALLAAEPGPAGAQTPAPQLAAIPTVLEPAQAELYRLIFRLHARGEWRAASREIDRLEDRRLLGHVLADRYLAPGSGRATFIALAEWLRRYADHPDAPAIHALAEARRPAASALRLRRPENARARTYLDGDDDASAAGEAVSDTAPLPRNVLAGLSRPGAAALTQVRQRIRQGDVAAALVALRDGEAARAFNALQADHVRAQIALLAFAQGNDGTARALAAAALDRSGARVPRALWVTGLLHARRGEHREAARYFEAMADSAASPAWDIAAGAFWAARMHARFDRPGHVLALLQRAADQRRTFYGLLAARRIDRPVRFDFSLPPLMQRDVSALARVPAGARALALMQIGEDARAEAELRRLHANDDPQLSRLLLPIAARANMPQLTLHLARNLIANGGARGNFASLYPLPRWQPDGGFRIDPALVFAVMRQESAFNPRAVSSAGARGLMQLMPATADELSGGETAGSPHRLFDPTLNIALAQRYLVRLLDHDQVRGDLVRLATAYNGGPGTLTRLLQSRDDALDDPLMFIESLPSPETRNFVVRVLFNYWVYLAQLGRPLFSLDQLAYGEWPFYAGPGGFETREARAPIDDAAP